MQIQSWPFVVFTVWSACSDDQCCKRHHLYGQSLCIGSTRPRLHCPRRLQEFGRVACRSNHLPHGLLQALHLLTLFELQSRMASPWSLPQMSRARVWTMHAYQTLCARELGIITQLHRTWLNFETTCSSAYWAVARTADKFNGMHIWLKCV